MRGLAPRAATLPRGTKSTRDAAHARPGDRTAALRAHQALSLQEEQAPAAPQPHACKRCRRVAAAR